MGSLYTILNQVWIFIIFCFVISLIRRISKIETIVEIQDEQIEIQQTEIDSLRKEQQKFIAQMIDEKKAQSNA